MQRTFIRDLNPQLHDKELLLKGWVHELRDLNKIKFIFLRDYTGIVQIVAPQKATDPAVFSRVSKLTHESVLEVTGTLKVNPEAKKGYEILLKEFKVLSEVRVPLPITVQEKGITTDL